MYTKVLIITDESPEVDFHYVLAFRKYITICLQITPGIFTPLIKLL